ncbi:MAG: hypothetical protein M2R45_05337 [Verrucomicrobia subdivision 3 bacterium]|nr:hypothetical protein [Limisphaerales bacterium]MCS1414945.1 hypothetical protein [Limisphaerales bacterium]
MQDNLPSTLTERKLSNPKLLSVSLLFLAPLFILLLLPKAHEPVHEGKTLSQWLETLYPDQPSGLGLMHQPLTASLSSDQIKARKAIQVIGTNQLPSYLKMISRSRTSFETRWNAWLNKLSIKNKSLLLTTAETTRMRGALAIHALGPDALQMKPELLNLLSNYTFSTPSAHALASLGPEVVPDMLDPLAHTNAWIQICAVWVLAQNQTASRAIVTNLNALLRNPNAAFDRLPCGPSVRSAVNGPGSPIHFTR